MREGAQNSFIAATTVSYRFKIIKKQQQHQQPSATVRPTRFGSSGNCCCLSLTRHTSLYTRVAQSRYLYRYELYIYNNI